MSRNFINMVKDRWLWSKVICIELDGRIENIPTSEYIGGYIGNNYQDFHIGNTISGFNRKIIEATKTLVCAYSINASSYYRYGPEGVASIYNTISDIKIIASHVPVILDTKCADAGRARDPLFTEADAITVNPYLGVDTFQPLLNMANKGVIVLCKTQNPGAGEFQSWDISGDIVPSGYMPLWGYVAHRVSSVWNRNQNCMVLVDGTDIDELGAVRKLVGNMPILITNVTKEDPALNKIMEVGLYQPRKGVILTFQHDNIFDSKRPNFMKIAYENTEKIHKKINNY